MKRTFLFLSLSALFLACCFLFTRLYRIEMSLLYFNDMGRDSLALLDWKETGKPPLLGPQTSALPFNQSAFYFYLLYPLFLLMHGSAFSAIYTNAVLYLVVFFFCFFMLRKKEIPLIALVVTFALFIIQPQFMIQNRFVWNPSFVGPFLLLSFFSFLLLIEDFTIPTVLLFSFSIAMSTAMSYSVIPVLISFFMYACIAFRKNLLKNFLLMCAATFFFLFLVNLPTVFFEVRHNFLLTKMFLTYPKLSQNALSFTDKFNETAKDIFATSSQVLNLVLTAGYTLLITGQLFFIMLYHKTKTEKEKYFILAGSLFLLSIVITFVTPISVQPHYVFGIVTLAFLALAFLPRNMCIVAVCVFLLVWLPPFFTQQYFFPAQRTVAQMNKCYAKFCSEHPEPMFVSVQAGFHPFHVGQEHRFLMRENGCHIPNIETDPSAAKEMVVIGDNAQYEDGKTAYNELTLFGPSHQIQKYDCQNNLHIYLLEHN